MEAEPAVCRDLRLQCSLLSSLGSHHYGSSLPTQEASTPCYVAPPPTNAPAQSMALQLFDQMPPNAPAPYSYSVMSAPCCTPTHFNVTNFVKEVYVKDSNWFTRFLETKSNSYAICLYFVCCCPAEATTIRIYCLCLWTCFN